MKLRAQQLPLEVPGEGPTWAELASQVSPQVGVSRSADSSLGPVGLWLL